MTAHSKEKRISIATVRDHYSTIAIPLVCNCTLPVKKILKTFFKILKAFWTGHGPFSIKKTLIFKINLSKNLHGTGRSKYRCTTTTFCSSFVPARCKAARLCRVLHTCSFWQALFCYTKIICFLYNVSILLNNMDKIDKCFQIFSFGILKM